MLLEKVPGGSGSVGAGTVLLERVMLVTAKIGHNVKSKVLIDILQSRGAINSTWANISKHKRSCFMIDPDGSPYHDALPTTRVFLHHTCICVTFTSFSPERDVAPW